MVIIFTKLFNELQSYFGWVLFYLINFLGSIVSNLKLLLRFQLGNFITTKKGNLLNFKTFTDLQRLLYL